MSEHIGVVGLACLDTVLVVEQYPSVDTKNVTKSSHEFGGGNGATVAIVVQRLLGGRPPARPEGQEDQHSCENDGDHDHTSTSESAQHTSKLYYSCPHQVVVQFVAPIFNDEAGRKVQKELAAEGLSLAYADFSNADTGRTGHSYIILDEQTHGRTIFHTTQEPRSSLLLPGEEFFQKLMRPSTGVAPRRAGRGGILFTDGRFEDTALEILKRAAELFIDILMDCERLRSSCTREMLDYCTVISCSETFLTILENQERLEKQKRGHQSGNKDGAVVEDDETPPEQAAVEDSASTITSAAALPEVVAVVLPQSQQDNAIAREASGPAKIQKAAAQLRRFLARKKVEEQNRRLRFAVVTLGEYGAVVGWIADDRNKEWDDSTRREAGPPQLSPAQPLLEEHFHIYHVPAWLPPGAAVVDTCGAGDAFNGGLVYAYAQGAAGAQRGRSECWENPCAQVLFASAVAGHSVTQLGARTAIPKLMRKKEVVQEFEDVMAQLGCPLRVSDCVRLVQVEENKS
ncbi:unnamed protein product [Amoebophrya sp. A120]|nr:unnamed protein product [Amoebophrya sp. A120]|eukprot:GSA120T00022316001.1